MRPCPASASLRQIGGHVRKGCAPAVSIELISPLSSGHARKFQLMRPCAFDCFFVTSAGRPWELDARLGHAEPVVQAPFLDLSVCSKNILRIA
jgi:hypothetical protein